MIHVSNNQGMGKGAVPLTIIPDDLAVKFSRPKGCNFGLC